MVSNPGSGDRSRASSPVRGWVGKGVRTAGAWWGQEREASTVTEVSNSCRGLEMPFTEQGGEDEAGSPCEWVCVHLDVEVSAHSVCTHVSVHACECTCVDECVCARGVGVGGLGRDAELILSRTC